MPCYFETADCFGTRVVGSHARWNGHVLVRHPDLAEYQQQVIRAIAAPLYVYQSSRRPNRRLFYREIDFPAPFTEEYLLAVVAYDPVEDGLAGILVTAYPASEIHANNLLLWRQQ